MKIIRLTLDEKLVKQIDAAVSKLGTTKFAKSKLGKLITTLSP